MGINNLLVEEMQIVSAVVPINLAAGANPGDWVSMKNYERCTFVVFKGAGSAGDDPVFTLEQAQAVAGTNNKALNFTRIDQKLGTQTGIGQFTTVTQAAANTYEDETSGEAQGIFVIEVKAEDLDVDGGFDCVQLSIADAGTDAQLGCALAFLRGARFGGEMPSAIVD